MGQGAAQGINLALNNTFDISKAILHAAKVSAVFEVRRPEASRYNALREWTVKSRAQ